MTIEKEVVTYQQIIDGYKIENDPFGLGGYTLEERIKKTFLENPNLTDYSKCMIFFDRVDGAICGRQMYFPTKVRIGGVFVYAQSGSSLETEEGYRQYAVGMDMINYPIKGKEYPLIIYGGVSTMVAPIYKCLKFHIFDIPNYWMPRRSRFIYEHLGAPSILTSLLSSITNVILYPILKYVDVQCKKETRSYDLKKMEVIPEWVNKIILLDNKKYSEYHDQKWMQWTIDNNFFGKEHECQSFYGVYKAGKPIGFFMTKERNLELPEHHIKQVIMGSVFEWGAIDDNILSEYDIYKMAVTTFSKYVDIISIASTSEGAGKKLKKLFMFRHGDISMAVKDLSKSYKDIGDSSNWRLRLGYCDVPFY